MSPSGDANKMIILKSSDGDTFNVEEAVALKSETIKRNIGADNCVILLPIQSKILEIVIEYCSRPAEDLKVFGAELVKVDDYSRLFVLAEAALHLKMESLAELTFRALSDILNGMNPEDIRESFNRMRDGFALADRMIYLKSSDGLLFAVEEAVAFKSETIKLMMEDLSGKKPGAMTVPLENVTSEILAKVIAYCKRHAATDSHGRFQEDLEEFDREFVKVDNIMLFDLVTAADYLHIKSLSDFTCQAVADMIKGMTVEEIRSTIDMRAGLIEEENAWDARREKTRQAL